MKTELIYNGFKFVVDLEKDKKFIADYNIVVRILNKGIENLSTVDRMQLLNVYKVAYHEDGKIEEMFSCDSSAHNCTFCEKMREIAEKDKTCICGLCYDYKNESYRLASLNRHSLNLLIMSTVEFTVEELSILPCGALCRVNSSGDTENKIHAKNMLRFAFAHPVTRIAYWAKNVPAVVAACREIGKPANLILVQSSIFINQPAPLAPFFDYVFTVYADQASLEKAVAAGACECNGKKCKDCGNKCYLGTWPAGANIAEYLRVGKADRARIIKALESKGIL